MDHWNYRVLRRTIDTPDGESEDVCQIIEVYYDGDRIEAWSPASPLGSSPRELAEDLRKMLAVAEAGSLTSDQYRALTPDELPGGHEQG